MTNDDDRLLPGVKKTLTRWETFEWPDTGRLLRDGDQTPYAVLTIHRSGKSYAFAAKEALRGGRDASFMPRLCKQARDAEAVLALFIGEEPKLEAAWVFDPQLVLAEGTERTVNSKQAAGVTILDIEARQFGVNLGDYMAGEADLPAAYTPDDGPKLTNLKGWSE